MGNTDSDEGYEYPHLNRCFLFLSIAGDILWKAVLLLGFREIILNLPGEEVSGSGWKIKTQKKIVHNKCHIL